MSMASIDAYLRETIPRLERMIEATAAKIIKDISDEIRKSKDDTKELLEVTNKQISLEKGKEVATTSNLHKYPYPNFRVGNENLGSSKDPKSLTWPFGSIE